MKLLSAEVIKAQKEDGEEEKSSRIARLSKNFKSSYIIFK